MNFKGDRNFSAKQWKCVSCGLTDTQEHLLFCVGYMHLRRSKNLSKEEDLLEYFKSILRERGQMVSLTAPAQSSGLCPYNLANVFCKITYLEFYIIIIYYEQHGIKK